MLLRDPDDNSDAYQADADTLRLRLAVEQAVAHVATMSATGQLDEKALAAEAVNHLSHLLDAQLAVVTRLDGDRFTTLASAGSHPVPAQLPLSAASGSAHAVRERRAVRVDGSDLDPRLRPEGQTSCAIAAPVLVEGEVWGTLAALTGRPGGFPAIAEELMERFALLIGAVFAAAEARDQLRHVRQRDRLIIAAAAEGISDVDITTGSVWWSERLMAALGYDERTFGGTLNWVLEHVIHPADQRVIATLLIHGGVRRNTLVRMRHADGSFRVMSARSASEFDENGNAVRRVSLYEDVTERERAEAQRVALARELHESVIENLRRARTHAETAQHASGLDPVGSATMTELARNVASAEDNLRLVVEALRADTTLLDARGPLSAVTHTLTSELRRRDPRLHVTVTDQLPDDVAVTSDAVAVCTQVLRESLLNVLQHASASKVTVALTPHTGAVRLDVSDDGDGFDPSTPAGSALVAGWQAKAAAAGGEVTVRSGIGAGTEVALTLPARPPAPTRPGSTDVD